jgi:hypothetical protein
VYYAIPISLGLGYIGGVVLSYAIGRRIVRAMAGAGRSPKPKRNFAQILGTIAGLAALSPGLSLGIDLGGSLGGTYGEVASMAIGLGTVGIPTGLAIGIGIVTTLVISGSVLVGAALGMLVNAYVAKGPASQARFRDERAGNPEQMEPRQ